jgi:hypothetical protein
MRHQCASLFAVSAAGAITIATLCGCERKNSSPAMRPPTAANNSSTNNASSKSETKLSLQQAQRLAENYLQAKQINVSNLTLAAKWRSAKDNGWTFIWAPPTNTPVFDSDIRVYVDDNGAVSHGGGS